MNSQIIAAVHIANGHTPGNAAVLAGYAHDDYVRAPRWYAKAARQTERGDKDPNASNKDKDEARLTRLVRVGLGNQIDRIWRKLGDPPDASKLDEEFWDTEEREWIAILRPELERMALGGASTLYATLPVGVDWALIATRAASWARQYSGTLIKGIDATTLEDVRGKVAGYVETPGQTMGDLRESLEVSFSPERANLIAVTEVTGAYAQGEAAVAAEAKEAGLEMTPFWQTNKDELVCDQCRPLDGQDIDEDEIPPLHPGCRCWHSYRWGKR
jgi:hypothetical protein